MEESSREVEMDPYYWGKLNPELIEEVLYRLPFSSLVKFRSVCKYWKYLIQSALLASTQSSPPLAPRSSPPKSVLFYHHSGGHRGYYGIWMGALLVIFNSKRNTWEIRSLPFFGTRTLVACDEGLLCFSSKNEPEKFIVYNPLTKSWRELTMPSSILPTVHCGAAFTSPFSLMLIGMVMNKVTGHYTLVVARFHETGPQKTFIYNSSTRTWKVSTPLLLLPTILDEGKWRSSGKSVTCRGNLYWFIHEVNTEKELEHVKAVVRFDLEREEWKVVKESKSSRTYVCPFQIATIGEYLFFLDWGEYQYWGHMNDEPVELQELGLEMRLMDRKLVDLGFMDQDTHSKHDERPYPVWSVTQGGLLYIVYYYPTEDSLKILVYEQSNGSVTWLPTVKHFREPESFWAFTPSLRAFA